jgi:hypothetical protein
MWSIWRPCVERLARVKASVLGNTVRGPIVT